MRLGIDYGTATTRAVLAWPDGRWASLLFDGSPLLPTGVYAAPDATLSTGEQAWRYAHTDPTSFAANPKQQLTDGLIRLGPDQVDVLDLAAATLRRVHDEAITIGGQAPQDVTMTVPASWGPVRRTALRRAATRAGLPQPVLIESPLAVAAHLLAEGATIPPGSTILICDLGAGGGEATVVRRGPTGFDVLSTIHTPDAGTLTIDAALAAHVATITANTNPPPQPQIIGDGRPGVAALAAARSAREALTHTPAVAVPTPPPAPAVIIDQATLHTLTQPALTAAAHTILAAVEAADLTLGQLAGVYCLGAASRLPATPTALAAALGTPPIVVLDSDRAALLGALHTTGSSAGRPVAPPTPFGRVRMRHVAAAMIPAAASLILVIQATATALPVAAPGTVDRNLFVITNWGEYAIAAILAVHTATAAATLIAAYLAPVLEITEPTGPPAAAKALARVLPAAAGIGVSVAGIYAITAALWHGVPNGPFLRWSLIPAILIALAAAAVGVAAPRRPRIPAPSWLDGLHIPVTATTMVAAGMFLTQYGHTDTRTATAALHIPAIYLGAALLGIGIALTLPIRLTYQVITAAPVALICAILTTGHATGTLGALYTLAAATPWLTRLTQMARGTRQPTQPISSALSTK